MLTNNGPTYLRIPRWLMASCLISNSNVFLITNLICNICNYIWIIIANLFLLNTKVQVNLAWPPVLTHWSMNTDISMPDTVKIVLLNILVLINMWPHKPEFIGFWDALLAKDKCLFKTYRKNLLIRMLYKCSFNLNILCFLNLKIE